MDSKEECSLRRNCKIRLIEMIDAVKRSPNEQAKQFILIGDQYTIPLISSCFKQIDLMDNGILNVDRIENERTKYQSQSVIYLLSPRESTLKQLENDFLSDKQAYYGNVHLNFTNKVNDELFKQVSKMKYLKSHIRTFKEINIDFSTNFDNQFQLNMENDIKCLFSNDISIQSDAIQNVASSLSTVVTSFEKLNQIEIIYNYSNNHISKGISDIVLKDLNDFMTQNQMKQSEQLDKAAGKITLIVLDRAFDPLSPALRDFFYQPMLYDIKNVQKDILSYQFEGLNKKSILNEDKVFQNYRFSHISEAMTGISDEFKNFVENNTVAKSQQQQGESYSFEEMSNIIKKMPEYTNLLNKYQTHMKVLEDLFNYYQQKNLETLGELEQTLATGLNENSQKLTTKQLLSQIQAIQTSQHLSKDDKLRLIFIAVICINLGEVDRKSLTNQFNEDQAVFYNLVWLGIQPQTSGKNVKSKKQAISKGDLKKAKKKISTSELNLCRITTNVESLLEELINNNELTRTPFNIPNGFQQLIVDCEDNYQTMGQKQFQPKKINALTKLMESKDTTEEKFNKKAKLIVFFAGGVSQSEIRAINQQVEELQQEVYLMIGGTSFMNPIDYVKKVGTIDNT